MPEPRDEKAQTCDVRGCGLPAVVLLANDAPLTSADYREWYACRWHERNITIPAAALSLSPGKSERMGTENPSILDSTAEVDCPEHGRNTVGFSLGLNAHVCPGFRDGCAVHTPPGVNNGE